MNLAEDVDDPTETVVAPEAAVLAAPREPSKAEREAHEAASEFQNLKERQQCRFDYMLGKMHSDVKVHPVMSSIERSR